jgi:probable F420-dependent oxidoreductase
MTKFGLMFANVGAFSTPEGAEAVGRAAEDAGFESIWTVEHVVVPAGYESEYPYDKSGKMPAGEVLDIPDPLVWLSFVAAHTRTIKLGTGILIVPQRNPLVLAKEVATLDKLSGGRMLLGVGAGWLAEEFDALGVPFEDRGRRLDDHIEVMRALWTEPQASHQSAFTQFENAISLPKPTQPSVPIVVGGHSKAAARRAGRLGDGFFPGRGKDEELRELLDVMRAAALDADRDPDAIEITAPTATIFADDAPVQVERWTSEMGVSRVIVPTLAFDVEGVKTALGQFGERVISKMA